MAFFLFQRVQARAIPCSHQPPTRGDNTVSITQGGTTIVSYLKPILGLFSVKTVLVKKKVVLLFYQ